jgi:hypothetical protein
MTSTIKVDTISENTSANGVAVDGVTLKDGAVGATGTATSVAGIPLFSDTTNGSIYTHDVSGTDDTAANNTAFGLTAMDAITTGDSNVAIGHAAGSAMTTSEKNVIVGKDAGLVKADSSNRGVHIGFESAKGLTTGSDILSIGYQSYLAADTETHNLAIGRAALGGSINGGEYNVAVGNFTLDALTSADYNTAVGYGAGTATTTGGYNVMFGANAGLDHTEGQSNVFIGANAGANQTTGSGEIYIGSGAGTTTVTGTTNASEPNTFVGYTAGYSITGETSNTYIGRVADGTGTPNGCEFNVGVGNYVFQDLTSGDYNTMVGYTAGRNINSGGNNTGIGIEAGGDTTTGSNNTFLGGEAGRSGSPNQVTTGSNAVVVGNNSVATAHIKVDWTVTSDKRDKADIEPLTMGLDFVNALNPVTYRWDMRSDYENKTPDGTNKKAKLSGGLLAQDVEILEREYGYKVEDETSILTTVNADGNYGLTYGKFVPVLINAVQELSAQVTTLQQEINTLKGE